MTYSATITSKGQLTIPSPVRKAFDLKQGDILEFTITSSKAKKAIIQATSVQDTVDRLFGSLGGPDIEYVSLEKVREVVGKKLGEKYAVK